MPHDLRPTGDAGDARRGRAAVRRGRRAGVPVVVLHDHRSAKSDDAVLGGAGALAEHRLPADPAVLARGGAPLVGEHAHAGVGVVGDHHEVVADERGRRTGSLRQLARLLGRAAVVALAPGDARAAAAAGVEPVQRVVADDEDAPGLVGGERVDDQLAVETEAPDPAGPWVDGADTALLRDEPDPAVPVGHQRDEAVALRYGRTEVVGPPEVEGGGAGRRLGLGEHPHARVGGLDDRAVPVVEVEVGAAAEVLERGALGARLARRQRVRGEHVEGVGVEHHQPRPLGSPAERDDPATAVERHGGALLDAVRRARHLEVVAERPTARVGVRGVGVVVHAARPVGREVRVLRQRPRSDRVRVDRRALERRDAAVIRSGRDRHSGSRCGEGEGEHGQRCGEPPQR